MNYSQKYMCLLIETIKIENGRVRNLPFHQQRVDRSIGSGVISLQQYIQRLLLPDFGVQKLRIRYDNNGIIDHLISEYIVLNIKKLQLVCENNIHYSKKYENRTALETLFQQKNGCDDILIIKNKLLTDSSYANVALSDGYRWYTPAEPLLEGTCRARLIAEGRVTPAVITSESLFNYQKLILLNAMIEFNENQSIAISPLTVVPIE